MQARAEENPEETPVLVDDLANPPWDNDRTCPICGETDLPLIEAVSDTGRIMLGFIAHCGQAWLRGPIRRNP